MATSVIYSNILRHHLHFGFIPCLLRVRYELHRFTRIFFFFSLFHQRADDEALTSFLQTSLFLVASPIPVTSMFLSFRSSLTLSIQVCFSFPLHVHVKLHLVIFSPPSFPRVQTTVISFS